MRRLAIQPRPDWELKVEELGLTFHHIEGRDGAPIPYWDESAYYEFTMAEVLDLERVTDELHDLCVSAVQHIINKDRFSELGIPSHAVPLIKRAWEDGAPSIYGRFDLRYDGTSPPKLLEYNADTPTALLEAAVVQWHWMEEVFPRADQFNSIHERLIAKWESLRSELRGLVLHFAYVEDSDNEDMMTAGYLQDTAEQARLRTVGLRMGDIGWNEGRRCFVDLDDQRITSIFKLYPWEWMVQEAFGRHLADSYGETTWIEPIWKMLLSNKAILAVLWELNPGHPNLLPAYLDGPRDMREYARKPLLGREGADVMLVTANERVESPGGFGRSGYVYQSLSPLPSFDGRYPVLGSWVIDGAAAGMGIRESDGLVTDNTSSFVPHIIAP